MARKTIIVKPSSKRKANSTSFKPGHRNEHKKKAKSSQTVAQEFLDVVQKSDFEDILKNLKQKAKEGDIDAQKFLINKFDLYRKESKTIELPILDTINHINEAEIKVVELMIRGKLTTEEVLHIFEIIQERKKSLELKEIKYHLKLIEKGILENTSLQELMDKIISRKYELTSEERLYILNQVKNNLLNPAPLINKTCN